MTSSNKNPNILNMTEEVGDIKFSATEVVHVAGKAHVKEIL